MSPATEDAIVLENVTKSYDGVTAVDSLSLSVPRGSIYGFIGPNGSGKTTTIRMIMNILFPDSGRIEVLGEHSTRAARDRVGYLPEERGLYKKMTVRRMLRYYGRLKGVPSSQIDKAITVDVARLGLADWLDKKVETLSKGMAQKIQFLSASLSKPELLILDEPFSGLDPVNADLLRAEVLELRRTGTTIVFSTHDMGVAEKLCDRIFMIFRGKKVLDGSLDDIQSSYGFDTVKLRTAAGVKGLEGLDEIDTVTDLGQEQEVRLKGDPQVFLRKLVARTDVTRFDVVRPSLHDIFVRIARPTAEDHKS